MTNTTSNLDFRYLHKELVDEFFYYVDQRGRNYFDSLIHMYWRSRGPILSSCAAAMPGSKFLITSDNASELPDLIRKALIVSDHVIIRHNALLPIRGLVLGSVPVDFAGFGKIEWIERHLKDLPQRSLPHFRSAPQERDLIPFIDWLCSDVREWFEKGYITYAPVLVPGHLEAGLLAEGINLSPFYAESGVIPQENKLINFNSAKVLSDLCIPYIGGINTDLLSGLIKDNPDTVNSFRRHLVQLISSISNDAGTDAFSRDVERLSLEFQEQTHQLDMAIHKLSKTNTFRRVGAETLLLSALVAFWASEPLKVSLAGLTASAIATVKALKDNLEDKCSLKENPVYFLAQLKNATNENKNWKPFLKRF